MKKYDMWVRLSSQMTIFHRKGWTIFFLMGPVEYRHFFEIPERFEALMEGMMKVDIAKIVTKYKFGDSKIFIYPLIPEKKMANAIAAYAPTVDPDGIIILLDETVFGSAKEGFLLTTKGIFCRTAFIPPVFFPISEIQDIWANKKDIYVNQKKIFSCVLLEKKYIQDFCNFLKDIVCKLQEKEIKSTVEHDSSVLCKINSETSATSSHHEIKPTINSARENFEKISKKYFFENNKIFLSPRIPDDKLTNAISAYAPQISSSEVLVLLDDTLMGGAKEGVILTHDKLFFHEFLEDPIGIKLFDIEDIYTKDRSIFVNGKKVFKATQINTSDISSFISLIEEFLDIYVSIFLSDEEIEERSLIKDLSLRQEYFFLTLFKNVLGKSQKEAFFNSIDIFFDRFLSVSQNQENAAWARSAQEEGDYKKAIAEIVHAMLGLAFEFSKTVSKKIGDTKTAKMILFGDCIIHEFLYYFLFKSTYFIHTSFHGNDIKEFSLFYIDELFGKNMLIPFYKWKISKSDSISRLQKNALEKNILRLMLEIGEERSLFKDTGDNIELAKSFLCSLIDKHLYLSGGKCELEILLTGDLSSEMKISNTTLNHCRIISKEIHNEINHFLPKADKILEDILADITS